MFRGAQLICLTVPSSQFCPRVALAWARQGGVDWDGPARASIHPKSSGKEAGQPLDCPGQQGAHLKACFLGGDLVKRG